MTNTAISPDEIAQYLNSKGMKFKESGKEWLLEICPFCGKKNHFYLCPGEDGAYNCKVCNVSGNFITLQKAKGDFKPKQRKIPVPTKNELVIRQRIWQEAVKYFESNFWNYEKGVAYWRDRGLTIDALRKFHFGFWKLGLAEHLKGKKFRDEDLIASNLIKKDDDKLQDLYRDVFVLPVFANCEILTFRFRTLPWGKVGKKTFSLKNFDCELYNQDALTNSYEVVIAEGEPDTIILDQTGISAVGLPGAGTFKDEWVSKFDKIEKVYIATDPDASGDAGFERIFKIFDRTVHKINMPRGKDINKFYFDFNDSEEFYKAFNDLKRNATMFSPGKMEEDNIESLIPQEGFIRDYFEYAVSITDCPKRFHLMGAYIIIATLLRNKVKIEFSAFTLKPNIYTVCLAGSTMFRKSTALRLPKKIIKHFEVDCDGYENGKFNKNEMIYPDEYSRESLFQNMADCPTGTFFVDEMGGFLSQLERNYCEGLKVFFTKIYDCPQEERRRLNKQGKDQKTIIIKDPCISIFGASTIDWFVKFINGEDVNSGFLPRFLFLPARTEEKFIALPELLDKQKFDKITDKANFINTISPGYFSFTPECRKIYEDWCHKFRNQPVDKVLEPFTGRYMQYALKLAMIYDAQFGLIPQDDEEGETVYYFSKRALLYGIMAVEFFFKEMINIFKMEIAFSKNEQDQNNIKKHLREAGKKGLTRTQLMKRTLYLSRAERAEILSQLDELGEIYFETKRTKVAGKPTEMVYLAESFGRNSKNGE